MAVGLLLLLLATPLGARTAAVELGATNREDGIAVPSDGDGRNTPEVVAGRACRRVADKSLYLYLQVDDHRFAAGDHTLYLTAELYDEAPSLVRVQYERATPEPSLATRYAAGGSMPLLGSGRWVRRTVRLERARMGNGQNYGSDLRLMGRFAVARLELSTEPPAGFDPERPIPPDEMALTALRLPEGMELTFGNDADNGDALLFKALGVTSVESYVTWQSVEDRGRGQWNWERWDRQVEILRRAGLKWVPFLIAGPAYATPQWFREGPQHHPYVCLEHGQPSKVESLWNPTLRPEIGRFLTAFAERYRDSGVIESLLLGVTGIYGESIYPAGPEGGWTADIPGPYHNHGGWWAGDQLAAADFRDWLQRRYPQVSRLNNVWGTRYGDFAEVAPFHPTRAPGPEAREDLTRWYEEAMTAWARWWVEETRRRFPTTEIYLCTGGDGAPFLGADFTAQARAIAPFAAGVRITNEGSSYPANFAVTREVATATRFYRTFCGFEPASSVSPEGNVARIYNATASGARQLHCYTGNVLGSPAAAETFRKTIPHLLPRVPPQPAVAVYLPRADWAQRSGAVGRTYELVRLLRELCDLDLVNRTSVADGILASHRLLLLPPHQVMEPEAAAAIDGWVAQGGIVARYEGETPAGLCRLETSASPPRWRLLVGVEGDQPFLFGPWHSPENGGEFPTPGSRKRWSGPNPGVHLPLEPGQSATIEIEAVTPDHALETASGAIELDGHQLGSLKPGHHIYRFELPAKQLRDSVGRLTFTVNGWQPSRTAGTSDSRVLGLALTRVEVYRAGAPAEALVNQGLTATVEIAKLPITRLGRGALVRLPADSGPMEPAILKALLGPLAAQLGLPDLLTDDSFDSVFPTPLAAGTLWLNMTASAVTKRGVSVPAFNIAASP